MAIDPAQYSSNLLDRENGFLAGTLTNRAGGTLRHAQSVLLLPPDDWV